MDPSRLITSYQQEVAGIAERAQAAREQVARVQSSVTSPDGAVTVTVNATGALGNVSFGPRADQLSRASLAALLMQTARRAQAQAARQVTTALAPLIGENGAAMDYLRSQLPDPQADEPDTPPADAPPPAPPTRPAPAAPPRPTRPPRARRPAGDDDDDFPGSIMTPGAW